jgi:hypothetical protein
MVSDTLRTQITSAIAAHSQWKQRLNDAIATGKSEYNPTTVRMDNQCSFGKWLYAATTEDRASEHYATVKALHANFHEATGEVLELALAGKKEEAKKATGFGSPYLLTSSRLVNALTKWSQS